MTLREYRQAYGFEHLAKAVGISVSHLNSIAYGYRNASIELCDRIRAEAPQISRRSLLYAARDHK